MPINVKVYRPDGTARAIWSRPIARVLRQHKILPVRGSHVIAVTEGRNIGMFHVDFSPLAVVTNNTEHCVCLVQTFESHEEAVGAEHDWLLKNWVLHE